MELTKKEFYYLIIKTLNNKDGWVCEYIDDDILISNEKINTKIKVYNNFLLNPRITINEIDHSKRMRVIELGFIRHVIIGRKVRKLFSKNKGIDINLPDSIERDVKLYRVNSK